MRKKCEPLQAMLSWDVASCGDESMVRLEHAAWIEPSGMIKDCGLGVARLPTQRSLRAWWCWCRRADELVGRACGGPHREGARVCEQQSTMAWRHVGPLGQPGSLRGGVGMYPTINHGVASCQPDRATRIPIQPGEAQEVLARAPG